MFTVKVISGWYFGNFIFGGLIGMLISSALPRFSGVQQRLTPAEGAGTFCGSFAEIDEKTGHCLSLRPIIVGPNLINLK